MVQQQVEPNRHALPAVLRLLPGRAEVRGYQCFTVGGVSDRGGRTDGRGVVIGAPAPHADDEKLRVKRHLLAPFFRSAVLRHRTLLDIGGNAGFFSFWAVSAGAVRADSIDVDRQYTELCRNVAGHLGVTEVRAHTVNLSDWHEPADVVLAFAMVHWLYSATTGYSSLEEVVRRLAERTRVLLLIEWVSPEDSAITFLGHTKLNVSESAGPYSLTALESALRERFGLVERVGRVSATREVLACWCDPRQRDQDMGWRVPPPTEAGGGTMAMWSSRCVATDGGGVPVWSRVFGSERGVVKQATVCLTRREAECLERLAGEVGFPRLLAYSEDEAGGTGVLEMERVDGEDVRVFAERLARAGGVGADRVAVRFSRELLLRVRSLRKSGIVHRDIRPANVLVREGSPVLIDFGWAVVAGVGSDDAGFVPAALGEGYRPPGGGFDDAYSAGRLLGDLLGPLHGGLSDVLSAMCSPEPSGRLGLESALELLERM